MSDKTGGCTDKEGTMKTLMGITTAIILLIVGFAAGYPVGKSVGFDMGSEWALVQAEILAREVGAFMPVYLDDGTFRVVIKQPRHLYRTAWKLAERDPDQTGVTRTTKSQGHHEQSAWRWETRAVALRVAGQTFTW
jgi:hypothetical protein